MITFNNMGRYGRTGNQMFQYATLYSIAKTRGYDFRNTVCKTKSENPYFKFIYLDEAFGNLSAKDGSDIFLVLEHRKENLQYNPGIFGVQDGTDIRRIFSK
jgi:hypothetical protein